MSNYDTDSSEADLIYKTLQKHYPAEIKKIQMQAANDMAMNGYVSKETDDQMNALMERVVADNKRLGRT
jgi:hypothetical protein